MTNCLWVHSQNTGACPYKVRRFALKHQGGDAKNRAESRLPDTKPRLYLREHISSKLLPHQLITRNSLGNGKGAQAWLLQASTHHSAEEAKPCSLIKPGQTASSSGANCVAPTTISRGVRGRKDPDGLWTSGKVSGRWWNLNWILKGEIKEERRKEKGYFSFKKMAEE